MVEGHGDVPRNEFAVLVFEDSDRTPFSCQNQIRPGVVVEVGEAGACHKSDVLQGLAVLLIEIELALVVLENSGRSRLRVSVGQDPASDKQVQIAFAVYVRQ